MASQCHGQCGGISQAPSGAPPSQIVIDVDTRQKIEIPFVENLKLLAAGQITKDSLFFCIATTEFSEWNDLFLYVVNSLKSMSVEFQYAAAGMQDHLNHIKEFLSSRPEDNSISNMIRNIPKVWEEKVLMVDDSPPILDLLERVLDRMGYLTATARNGKEGLEQIQENYFDVIISDINMPVMTGMDFFQEASRNYPNISRRFLFYSGQASEENKAVIEENGIHFLVKPAGISDLKRKVAEIVEQNRPKR